MGQHYLNLKFNKTYKNGSDIRGIAIQTKIMNKRLTDEPNWNKSAMVWLVG